jgi:hypothetical protein
MTVLARTSSYASSRRLPRPRPRALALVPVGALVVWLGLQDPLVSLLLVAIGALAVWVVVHPSVAAYALIVVTPLTAGIDRGAAIPVLRPNEALAAVVGTALIVRALLLVREGTRPRMRLSQVEWALLAMAVSNSVVPLLWMLLRHQELTGDDLLYALVMWKFAAVYLIVRVSVRTEPQVRRCLYLSLGAATVVAVIAILQALNLLNVRGVLATYFIPNGHVGALAKPRGGSTLALPAAVADLMIFNLALVVALLSQRARPRTLFSGVGVIFVLAAISAGEFSSALGLVVGGVLIAVVVRRPRLLLLALPLGALVAIALWPVISARLMGFESVSGLPVSWTGRLDNLKNYFLPPLMSHGNYLFGVRPSARIAVPSQATGYVWIESGYIWLLWGGGIPLLLAFLWFVRSASVRSFTIARSRRDAVGVAATGLLVGVVVTALLMLFDPHLTYRGSADALFILAALARCPAQPAGTTASSAIGPPKGAVAT